MRPADIFILITYLDKKHCEFKVNFITSKHKSECELASTIDICLYSPVFEQD